MATTTNFGWETPDDTDLVKDGALAIRTLGNSIDTSLVDLKGGTTGQVLSKTSNTDMDFTWVTSDDANAIQNAIVDAKGDLIAASAADTPARLAVGNNGETLVADSSASTGLRWQSNFAAGKNAVINGDFRIWQRGTSFSTLNSYCADRYVLNADGGSMTVSQQTFTLGSAPVAGYEGLYYLRMVTTVSGSLNLYLVQKIEDVRTFANQTVTLSYWAKCSSGTVTSTPLFAQNFGSGGSSEVVTNASNSATITTTWTRFSHTVTLPSISGKTVGSSSHINMQILRFAASATVDIWGVQLEAGNTATAFQTATGTLAGELAACQRYYYRETADSTYAYFGFGMATLTTSAKISIPAPVTMRVVPTSIDSPTASTLRFTDGISGTACNASPTLDSDCTNEMLTFNVNVASGLTQYRPVWFGANNSSSAYIGFSAEL